MAAPFDNISEFHMRQLILDTLYARRMYPPGSCLVSNEAGLELVEVAHEALDAMRQVIVSEVLPRLAAAEGKPPWTAEIPGLHEKLGPLAAGVIESLWAAEIPGLDYVLGAYLIGAVRLKDASVLQFLLDQPSALVREAIHAAGTHFFKARHGYNHGVAPDETLFTFLEGLGRSDDPDIAQRAKRTSDELRSSLAED